MNYLENSGVYYLGRFAASTSQFRSVMLQKIRLSCADHLDQDFDACACLLEKLIEKFIRLGYLNDENYTKNLYRSLLARGLSLQKIKLQLNAKGCPKECIEKSLLEYSPPENHELLSALRLAKRKKLGPYCLQLPIDMGEKRKQFQRQLAIFGRQNFSYKVALEVLKLSLEEAEVICGKLN